MSSISGTESALVTGLIFFVVAVFALHRAVISVIERRVRVLWRVDAKLDLLLKHAAIEFDPYKNLPTEVADAMQRGEKIRAIKYFREATGAGLKEAKDFIEEAQRRLASSPASAR